MEPINIWSDMPSYILHCLQRFGQNMSGGGVSISDSSKCIFFQNSHYQCLREECRVIMLSYWQIFVTAAKSHGVNLLSHFCPSSVPLFTYQPIFLNFLCSIFCSRSLSLKGQGSEWVCLKHGLLQSTGGVISTGKGNAPAPPAVGPDDFGRPEEGHLL